MRAPVKTKKIARARAMDRQRGTLQKDARKAAK
jgi:hypothetical protein